MFSLVPAERPARIRRNSELLGVISPAFRGRRGLDATLYDDRRGTPIKSGMLCGSHPRCAWHESQISDAGCVPPPGPINAVVQPHSHGSGRRSVSPKTVSDAAFVLLARASAVACAALVGRVVWERKVTHLHLPDRSHGREVYCFESDLRSPTDARLHCLLPQPESLKLRSE
jgi:hypothetical protein